MSAQGSKYTESVSQRAYSSQQPISRQFVSGYRNKDFINPTYESHVLPHANSPGKVAAREDTSYKQHYRPYESSNPFQKSQTRDRGESKRRFDVQESRSNLDYDDNKSRSTLRTRSSRQMNEIQASKLDEVTRNLPMEQRRPSVPLVLEKRPSTHHTKTQSSVNDLKTPIASGRQYYEVEESAFLRSKAKKDTVGYHNPTFRSQILNSVEKVKTNVQRDKWETTTKHAFELPLALKEDQKALKHSKPEEREDYKPWRRQPAEPLASAKKYEDEYKQPAHYQELPSPQRKQTHQPGKELESHYYQMASKEYTDHAKDLNYRYYKDDQN